jgi:prephenate dehydratase
LPVKNGVNIVKEEILKKIVISTLGPEGTCSEYASQFYIDKNNYEGTIELYSSFEESVEALKNNKSDCVIIPSAYKKLAEIIFQEQNFIEIVDVFKLATPNLVIAKRRNVQEVKKVATHSSPSSLAKGYFPDAELVLAKSNSAAAQMLLASEVDACITTIVCAKKHSLYVIHDFGGIAMGWNVLKKKARISTQL